MTANLQIDTLIAAIADLVVTGWEIRDLTNVPEQVDTRANAVLFPDVANLVTDLSITRETWGLESIAAENATYTIGYIFAYKEAESGRRITDYLGAMVSAVDTLIETIVTTDFASSGGITVQVGGVNMGIVTDPAGKHQFFGGVMKLSVLEFIQ